MCMWEYRFEIIEFFFFVLVDEIFKIVKENKNIKNGILLSIFGFFFSYFCILFG